MTAQAERVLSKCRDDADWFRVVEFHKSKGSSERRDCLGEGLFGCDQSKVE